MISEIKERDGMQMFTVLSQEKTTSPYFQSVYSRDTLLPLQENMWANENSDDSLQSGTHWAYRLLLTQSNTGANSMEYLHERRYIRHFFIQYLKLRKKVGERSEKKKKVDLTVSSKKKKTQLSISAENSAAATPENSTTVSEHSAIPETLQPFLKMPM
ncbi:hypothetical protein TNCV_251421 [Trichonephila clavipes]|nr:hypothetical protein TNCV_251421 [Trichonephila clavipes]